MYTSQVLPAWCSRSTLWFLKIVNRVGLAHGLIVRDPKTKMKVWAAVLVACHARFDPRAYLAFSRFLLAWGSEYARYIKRKVCSSVFYSATSPHQALCVSDPQRAPRSEE